ncbi:hypothetical protein [Kitasatospora herbaricolor]|uniref:hypothetical protein n=1 Tax=Kitasatospora herbaricolor TaxID=68217 RepID=UPI0036D9C036
MTDSQIPPTVGGPAGARVVVDRERWIAVYEQGFLVERGGDHPILHDAPDQAAHTVMQACPNQV